MLEPQATRFIGLANYLTFLKDPDAGASLFGSLSYFLLSVPLEMVVALLLAAVFTSDRLRGKRIMRTLFFMPSIIPAIAIFIIISGLIDPNTGWIVRLFHLSSATPLYTLFPIILSLWTIGPGFLIMLGAMQAVPKELYEAARVDGAGPVNRFISITIPMCSPAIFFSLVINMISAFGGVALIDRGLILQPEPFSDGILHYPANVLLPEPGICQCPGLGHVHPGHGCHAPACSARPATGSTSHRKTAMKKSKHSLRGQSSTLTLRAWEFTGTALLTLLVWIFLLVFLSPLSYMVVTSLRSSDELRTPTLRFIRPSA